ncbi:MAG: spermidine synthase [Magnetococcales bacterium]|nr:spermidine synthase [Magnetococcales bacterium]MBF0323118.1 spermidine synthase [Magnetococcales bacterium]
MNLTPGSITQSALIVRHRSPWNGEILEVVDDGPLRVLHFGTYLKQSCILRANPQRLVLPYTRHMLASLAFKPEPRRALMVGLGGGTMARFLLEHFPACQVDVVEIVPTMPDIARHYFGLPLSPRLRIHLDDGAHYLHVLASQLSPLSPPPFDLLLIDAYNAQGMAEALFAATFFQNCHTLLEPQGVMAVNLTRSKPETFSQATAAIEATFAGCTRQLRPAGSNNVILFASPGPEPLGLRRMPRFLASRRNQRELTLAELLDPARQRTLSWWKYILEF